MPSRLIIDGNNVYEVDEDCERSCSFRQQIRNEKERETGKKRKEDQGRTSGNRGSKRNGS